jgi:uncharacterized protein YegP (UPF0339 family)
MAHFKIFKSEKNKQFYFNFIGNNGQVMLQSEGYTRKSNAKKAITAIKKGVLTAITIEK